jgi:GDP-L-fucose synthase
LTEIVMSAIGYNGRLTFDSTKPDGTPRKLLDVSRLTELGWQPRVSLKNGIERTYAWFREHFAEARL